MHVADAAEGIVSAMENYDGTEPCNLGSSKEVAIKVRKWSSSLTTFSSPPIRKYYNDCFAFRPCDKDVAMMLCELTKFAGEIRWDTSKPDGPKRRVLNCERARTAFGFEAKIPLYQGLKDTVEWWEKFRDSQ